MTDYVKRVWTDGVGEPIDDVNLNRMDQGIADAHSDLAAKVPTSRTITTSAPLQGGGTLSANRTLTIDTFTATVKGAVPPPATVTGKVLSDDGTWVTPAGGGGTTNLDGLTDVTIATPTNDQVLTYETATSQWKNKAAPAGGGGATVLDGLTDVTIASPANGQVLTYDTASTQWKNLAAPGSVADLYSGGFYLDSYSGTDDQRLTAAIADQQASTSSTTNKPPIILPSRVITFTTPRTMYNGLKVIGAHRSGQKTFVGDIGPEITLGGSISSGTSSWWNGTGSIYDVFMSDFSVNGSQGSSTHQFVDQPSGTLYGCQFTNLSFYFMRGVFGRDDRKCLMTQVALTGSWTANNAWACQFHIGGSDCVFWMDSFNNVGVSQSAAQTGGLTTYFARFDSLEVTLGKLYVSAMNGWRGILISGGGSSIDMHGGVYEGYKPTRINGLLAGPGPGSLIKITDGAVAMHGVKIGQGMDNPDASEGGLLDISGGEVSLHGVTFYGLNMGAVNAVRHTGGRVSAVGILKRQNESGSWSGRPRYTTTATSAPAANATGYSFYNPDLSMQ